MTRADEPPDWALPAWDDIVTPAAPAVPAAPPSGTPPVAPPSGAGASAAPAVPVPAAEAVPVPAAELPGLVRPRIFGVGELTRAVRDALRADERLRDVWVEGEVGRVTVSTAGHAYFTLKDERAQLGCVMFRDAREASPFAPETGLRIVAHGRIDLYEQSGVYQLYVETLQPAGFGELALRFEALKAKLAAEGLFAASRKRPLPVRPTTIAVVTSETGAVWHDIRTVVERRWPLTRVVLVPCLVQGDAAPASIVAALGRLTRWIEEEGRAGRADEAPAVTILARGGGSLEDLWSFNDERVVRAVVAHPVPLVSGVGHEIDVTLADLAADVRAPTPSAAAELVVPDGRAVTAGIVGLRRTLDALLADRLRGLSRELAAERRALDGLRPADGLAIARERAGHLIDAATRSVRARLAEARRSVVAADGRLAPLPGRTIADAGARLERSAGRLPVLAEARLAAARTALAAAGGGLPALAPAATLARGYAIVRRSADGGIVRRSGEAPAGTALTLDLAEGRLAAVSEGEDRGGPGDDRGGLGR